MVEVLIAIGVMGVGISLIMVLFPVALQGARDTEENTYVSTIASQVVNYYRVKVASEGKAFNDSSSTIYDLNNEAEFNALEIDIVAPDYEEDTSEWSVIPSAFNISTGGTFEFQPPALGSDDLAEVHEQEVVSLFPHDSEDGRFLFLFKSAGDTPLNPATDTATSASTAKASIYTVLDFAAEVNVYKEEYSGEEIFDENTISDLEKYGTTLFIHISWPIDRPLENRKVKVYVVDLFNSKLLVTP